MDTEVAETDNNGTPATTNSPPPLPPAAGRMAFLHRLWTKYGAFEGECMKMPGSTLKFVVSGLLGFVAIKSQDEPGFPFQTRPRVVMVAITSLLIYGLASAAGTRNVSSGERSTSVSSIVACFGRMVSLYMLVASLASLFYF